jgi:type IV secretion system protein VirB11
MISDEIARYLGHEIMALLESGEVSEIMLNPDGGLWVDSFKDGMYRTDINVDPRLIENMVRTLATHENRPISAERPHLQANLPLNNERFQAMLPPIVDKPCFSIRTPASRVFGLDEYFSDNPELKERRERKRAEKNKLQAEYDRFISDGVNFESLGDFIRLVMKMRKNIFVTGATGSGKTTFLNAILDSEDVKADRCYVMQDTPELQMNAPNKIMCRWNDLTSPEDLLKIALRMRPDRCLIGEVRGAECLDLLNIWNTGHSGGVASAHANSGKDTLTRVDDMLLQHPNITTIPHSTVAAAIDIIVYMENLMIVEVLEVKEHDGSAYITNTVYSD